MARSSALAAVKPAGGSKALSTIDQEMAMDLASLKSQIGSPSGNKIKVEATGDFVLPDGTNMGNEIQVVVVDFVTKHTFYDGPYNPGNPTPPACYAIGKDLATMAPEADSPQVQHGDCRTCPLNAFGSGSNGKSKACKNARMAAVIVIDPENANAARDPSAPVYMLELPPTAIKSFEAAISGVARALGLPVKAILTVSAKNVGTYALITFSDPIPNPNYALHYGRKAEVQDALYRKPDFAAYEAKAPAARGRSAAPARRTASARR